MKGLSIEEKAKCYDEAIERARVWKEKSGMPADRQGIIDDIFPELKESEGEKIRKGLIAIITDFDNLYLQENYSLSREEVITWLEKQGEQMPAKWNVEEVAKHYLYSNILYDDVYVGNPTDKDCIEMFKAGANWQKQQMMAKAVDAQCFGFQGAALFSFRLPADKYLVGSEVKVIVIKK